MVAIRDINFNVITPCIKAPSSRSEIILLALALDNLLSTTSKIGIDIKDSIMSLNAGYSSDVNRKKYLILI